MFMYLFMFKIKYHLHWYASYRLLTRITDRISFESVIKNFSVIYVTLIAYDVKRIEYLLGFCHQITLK